MFKDSLLLPTNHTHQDNFDSHSRASTAPAAAQALSAHRRALELLAPLFKWINVATSSCHWSLLLLLLSSLLLLLLLLLLLCIHLRSHRQRVNVRRQSDPASLHSRLPAMRRRLHGKYISSRSRRGGRAHQGRPSAAVLQLHVLQSPLHCCRTSRVLSPACCIQQSHHFPPRRFRANPICCQTINDIYDLSRLDVQGFSVLHGYLRQC